MFKKDFKKTSYLYGVSPLEFIDLKYEEILEKKIELNINLLEKLAKEASQAFKNKETNKYRESTIRLSDVAKAYDHNTYLLKELKKAKRETNKIQ